MTDMIQTSEDGIRALPVPTAGQLRAVFFDFDGVILESAEIKDDAFRELFSHLPEHHERILEHHHRHLGRSRCEKFEWIYEELLGLPLEKSESTALGRRFSDLVRARMLDCPYTPGVISLLDSLSDRVDCFVVSGTPQEELEALVGERGLARYFRAVVGSPPRKSESFQALFSRYDLPPREVLAIGDALSDYEAAMSAGVRFVARISSSSRQDWSHLSVVTVRSLDELMEPLGLLTDK